MLLALLITAAPGCPDSDQAPPPVARPIAPRPVQKPISEATPTVVEQEPQAVYSYNPQGRRDPFASIIVRAQKPEADRHRPPLERYDVSEFKLTAVLWGGFGYKAMVEGPDGKGYFVRVGTVMGLHSGVVKRITQDKMVIEERFRKFSGETERKEIVIELRKKQEELQ